MLFPEFGSARHIRQVAVAVAPQCRQHICRHFCKKFGSQACPDPNMEQSKGELCKSFEVKEHEPVRLASLIHEFPQVAPLN
jgi:hypothetical protein